MPYVGRAAAHAGQAQQGAPAPCLPCRCLAEHDLCRAGLRMWRLPDSNMRKACLLQLTEASVYKLSRCQATVRQGTSAVGLYEHIARTQVSALALKHVHAIFVHAGLTCHDSPSTTEFLTEHKFQCAVWLRDMQETRLLIGPSRVLLGLLEQEKTFAAVLIAA